MTGRCISRMSAARDRNVSAAVSWRLVCVASYQHTHKCVSLFLGKTNRDIFSRHRACAIFLIDVTLATNISVLKIFSLSHLFIRFSNFQLYLSQSSNIKTAKNISNLVIYLFSLFLFLPYICHFVILSFYHFINSFLKSLACLEIISSF